MAPKAQPAGAQLEETPRARARATYVRVTPRKARRVIDLIRGLPTDEALTLLRFAPQAASEPIYKVVASAVANAEHNLRLDPDSLVVAAAYVDEGPMLKRFRPRAQGRAYRINKRTSHITIELESVQTQPAPPKPAKAGRATKAVKGGAAKAPTARAGRAQQAKAATATSAGTAEAESVAVDSVAAEVVEAGAADATATEAKGGQPEVAQEATEAPAAEHTADGGEDTKSSAKGRTR